jgi:nucleoside-diphosphate-sugar epimerase
MKILVTGGAGYIGSKLVSSLLDLGHHVVVIDNLMYRQTSLAHLISNSSLEFHHGDIRDFHLMEKLIASADAIFPLAAIVGAPACSKDPILAKSVNNEAIKWMLSKLSKNQVLIMPTTNSAYGQGEEGNFCDENSPLNPLSLYAKDKVEVEQALMEKENVTSLRLATVFGISPRMRLDLLVNNFVFHAVTDGFLVIFEGHFKRNYIHINDVVQAFILALNNRSLFSGEIFNVGLSEANISKLELCKMIKEVIAPNFIFFEDNLGKDPDKRNYIVSNTKIERAGFSPKVSLNDGLKELYRGMALFSQKLHANF